MRYFPLFEGDVARSVWDTVSPDLLGVRTSMAPASSAAPAPASSPSAREEDSPGPFGPNPGTLSLTTPELSQVPHGNPPVAAIAAGAPRRGASCLRGRRQALRPE